MADTLSLTAEEQNQLDQMREDDAQTGSPPQPTPGATTESPEPDQQQPAQPPRTVPLAALHEERERRKESDRRLAEEQQRIRTLEERTNLLLQRFGQPQPAAPAEPPKPAIPELATDPVGHIIGTQQELSRQLQANQQNWQQQQNQMTQFQQAQLAIGNLVSRSQGLERQFAAEHPDYQQAIDHLRSQRTRELEIAGIREPGRRIQIMEEEGLGIQIAAFQNNANPAEMLYELAKLRGYAGAASQQTTEEKPASPQPTAAQERIQNIQQGQQQARSLSGARGSGPQNLTAQRLLEMNDNEFAKMLETKEGMELLGA